MCREHVIPSESEPAIQVANYGLIWACVEGNPNDLLRIELMDPHWDGTRQIKAGSSATAMPQPASYRCTFAVKKRHVQLILLVLDSCWQAQLLDSDRPIGMQLRSSPLDAPSRLQTNERIKCTANHHKNRPTIANALGPWDLLRRLRPHQASKAPAISGIRCAISFNLSAIFWCLLVFVSFVCLYAGLYTVFILSWYSWSLTWRDMTSQGDTWMIHDTDSPMALILLPWRTVLTKRPTCSACSCQERSYGVCVCEPSEEMYIKLLSFAGGPWALGWHGPTKTHPSCCANVPAIFESWRGVANPRTTMVTMPFLNDNHIRIFEFSTWTDEGDFSFICLHSWRNLRLRWISCPLQFSAYIAAFFLASIDFIPVFKVATNESSLHSTPNTLLFLSGVTGLFLHVRCAPQQNSQWQFWASVWLMLDLSRWHEPFGEYLSR